MSYDVLNINKERDLCCTASKRIWDEIEEEINNVAREQKLSPKEKESLLQRTMASFRYSELEMENKYLSRSQDVLSIRKINRNKLEMQRMTVIYNKHEKSTQKSEPLLEEKLNKREQEKNKNKKKQTGK